jgi:hypothetical protein
LNGLDVRIASADASCSGVNLGFAGFGVAVAFVGKAAITQKAPAEEI